jgi:ribosomal protein S12
VKALPGVRYCVVGVESVAQFEAIAAAWRQAQTAGTCPNWLPTTRP